ncbi:Adaptive-response sensory-kinase SasA [Rhizobium rhizogenes]|uniref:histidine kinase n=2 Tax=Rhizobium rhizogenes TaxID=359 RepID=A0AAN2A8I9_RHIRH|nr:PAS domain S-box protein [Rhizobium rhizogenes]CAD0215592.1 Adaptive-response sensory-kinase SasA [Rhizobium rhizogenes]
MGGLPTFGGTKPAMKNAKFLIPGGSLRKEAKAPSNSAWYPWPGDSPGPLAARIDLLSLIPLIAIIALAALVWAFVWAVARDDSEGARIKLATDALWVEQTLRFQLGVDEDMLVRLAMDHAGGTEDSVIAARARSHISTNPEVVSILWYGPDGRAETGLPDVAAPGDPALVAQILEVATATSRPVYGNITSKGLVTFGLLLADRRGALTATISLPSVLDRHLPWWIAEQYGVTLVDLSGNVLANRQRLEIDPENPTHVISIDPPLHGTWLRISAYGRPLTFLSTALFGAIAGLAVFAVLAMAILHRSSKRRRDTEMRLWAETAFRRSMEESLTVGLRAKDHEGRILFVNPAFCKLVGWTAQELVGHAAPLPYWDPKYLSETEQRHRRLAAGGAVSQRFETRFVSRDGREIEVEVYEAPLIDARGEHRGWMGSIIDVTEARQAARRARLHDEALARTGRLVTLGEMASTLSHELNQPLSAIASYAAGMLNLMNRQGTDLAVLREATEKLARQADRAGLIIRRIQDLVKKREPRFSNLQLSDVIDETLDFLQADAREHGVRLVQQGPGAGVVAADAILLEQVLINLIRNGMEAMAESGKDAAITVRLFERDGLAVIEVEDGGAGIPAEMVDTIYDAFASTKAQGMGMGLKICRTIIELHRGHLTHHAACGGGTVFTVALPLSEAGYAQPAELEET